MAFPLAMGLMTAIPPVVAGVGGLIASNRLRNIPGYDTERGILSGTVSPLGKLVSIWNYMKEDEGEPPKSDWLDPDSDVDPKVKEWSDARGGRTYDSEWNNEGTKIRWVGYDETGLTPVEVEVERKKREERE